MLATCTLLAAGCDDETTPSPDASAAKDGGTSDGSSTTMDSGSVSSDGGSTADASVSGDGSTGGLTTQQARGQYLVDHVIACPDCHTPRNAMGAPIMEKYMSGAECLIKLPNGDCLNSKNLTNHETGLKNRTAEEIKDMFLNGIRPAATGGGSADGGAGDGGAAGPTALNPFMPYYVFHNMDTDDADAIVAYLRTIPGVDHAVPRRGASFDVPAPAPALNQDLIPMPAANAPNRESELHGRYLTSKIGLCVECHTQHNAPGPGEVLMTAKLFQGGEMFPLGFPITPVSKNLTSDMATGLGTWTVDQIITVLKQGKDKDGKGICPPMPVGPMGAYGGLTDQDARDIANYIKSLPAASNLVPDMCTFPFPMPPASDAGASDGSAAVDASSGADASSSADASVDSAASGG